MTTIHTSPANAAEAIENLASRWGALPAPVRASFAGIMLSLLQTEANKAHAAAEGFKYHTLDRRALVCYSLEDAAHVGMDLMRLLTFIADTEIVQNTPDTYIPEALRASESSVPAGEAVGERHEEPWTLDLDPIVKHMTKEYSTFHHWAMRLPYYVAQELGSGEKRPATFSDLYRLCENKWLLLVALKVADRELVVSALCDVLEKAAEGAFEGTDTETKTCHQFFRRAVDVSRKWACDPTERNSALALQVGDEIHGHTVGRSCILVAARGLTYLTSSRSEDVRVIQTAQYVLEEIESIGDPHGEDGDREPSAGELAEYKEVCAEYGAILRSHFPREMLEKLVREYAKRNNCEVHV